MNTIMYNHPLGILDEIFNMDTRAFRNVKARAAGRFPPVNVYLNDNAVIVDVELPGKSAKDVALTLEAQAVVIADKPVEDSQNVQWSRRLELPFRVNADKANAKFENGVLRIELPKAETEGVRRIVIAE